MKPWNPLIPQRPRQTKDGERLVYRTHIDKPDSTYDVLSVENRIAQIKLYHWCKSLDFVNMVPIANLHEFLFYRYPSVTKRNLGRTIAQTVPYKCTVLKGVCKDNDHAQMCYAWKFREELEYGLEWMLSMWIWGIEADWRDKTPEEHAKRVTEIFEELGALDEQEFEDEWMDLIRSGEFMDESILPGKRMDWPTLWDKHGLAKEGVPSVPKADRPKLKSFK